MSFSLIAAVALASGPTSGGDVGTLVRALWLVQRYGNAEAVDPVNDHFGLLRVGTGRRTNGILDRVCH
jgi:hypothetical protein